MILVPLLTMQLKLSFFRIFFILNNKIVGEFTLLLVTNETISHTLYV